MIHNHAGWCFITSKAVQSIVDKASPHHDDNDGDADGDADGDYYKHNAMIQLFALSLA